MQNLIFVVNVDWFFLSHRLPIALEAIKRGYNVFLLSANTGKRTEIESYGINFIEVPFQRSGSNLLHEFRCIWLLYRHYKKINPSIIHHVTLKASLLGSISSKISGKKNIINAISGLGYNFTNERNGILQRIVRLMMNLSFKSNYFYFILQNPDDIQVIKELNLVPVGHLRLIKGSGVNLEDYPYSEFINKDKLYILFPARLLYDKGLLELIKAANVLKKKWEGKIQFILAGDFDEENKATMHKHELVNLLIPGYIEWIGFQKDMAKQYKLADVVVLPSYREGLPKSLIEACSIGRPIITTNVPGCKECCVEGFNGRLVPVKTVDPLAAAIDELCSNEEMRKSMGRNSRTLAEKEFSIQSVLEKTLSIYCEIENKNQF